MLRIIITRIVSVILPLIFFMGCQISESSKPYMMEGIDKGTTKEEVLEKRGEPMEVELLSSGKTRLGYLFEERTSTKIFGITGEEQAASKRLDVIIDQANLVESCEIVAVPETTLVLELFIKANNANTNGNYKEALQILNKLLAESPYFVSGRQIRASIYWQGGRLQDAINDYEFILKNDPSNFLANYFIGRVCYDDKKYQQALESLTQAIKIQPNSALAHSQRARAYLKLDQIELAKKDIQFAQNNGFAFSEELKKEFNNYGVKI